LVMEGRRRLNVVLDTFDGRLHFTVFSKTKGKELFDKACETLELREVWFLGVAGAKFDGSEIWLEMDREIVSQRFRKNGDTLELVLKFRFFPTDVNAALSHDAALKLLYLQVKEDILSGRIYCPKATAIELASFAAQVQFGSMENDPSDTDYLKGQRWVPESATKDLKNRSSSKAIRQSIAALHKQHFGKTIATAIRQYLVLAQTLSTFGLSLYECMLKRGDDKQKCFLGLSPHDVRLYEEGCKIPIKSYPWRDVSACSQTSNRLRFKLKTSLHDPDFEVTSKHADAIYECSVTYQQLYGKHLLAPLQKRQEDGHTERAERGEVDEALEAALFKEKEAREMAEQEKVRLQERHVILSERLRETETENVTLRQKLAFMNDKVARWRTQLLRAASSSDERSLSGRESLDYTFRCNYSSSEDGERCSRSRLPRPRQH